MPEPRVFRQSRFLTPPGAAELVLVRHGESEPLVEGTAFPLVDGHGDPALAPEGRVQADRVGDRLTNPHLANVRSSRSAGSERSRPARVRWWTG